MSSINSVYSKLSPVVFFLTAVAYIFVAAIVGLIFFFLAGTSLATSILAGVGAIAFFFVSDFIAYKYFTKSGSSVEPEHNEDYSDDADYSEEDESVPEDNKEEVLEKIETLLASYPNSSFAVSFGDGDFHSWSENSGFNTVIASNLEEELQGILETVLSKDTASDLLYQIKDVTTVE